MSLAELTDDDIDRLADYTAGVLEPQEVDAVASLIRTDERWARAHAELVAVDPIVSAQLREDALTSIEPMPADVVSRIDAALASASVSDPAAAPARSDATVVSLESRRGRGRGFARRLAFVGTGAAAAAAFVLGGVILTTSFSAQEASTTASGYDSANRAPAEAPPALTLSPSVPEMVSGAGASVQATGVNYTAKDLATLARRFSPIVPGTSSPQPTDGGEPDRGIPKSALEVPAKVADSVADQSLERLTKPDALRECLTAVLAAHPGRVEVVDFAQYEGSPALIVIVKQAGGSIAVAAGPNCGLATADEKAAVQF